MYIVDSTWITIIFMAVVVYFCFLGLVMLYNNRYRVLTETSYSPFYVIIVPARNEELVIENTIKSFLKFDHDKYFVMIMNDGSTDKTSEIAHQYESTNKVKVIDRGPEIAGKGKGKVLNHAYQIICTEMQKDGDSREIPMPVEVRPEDVIICIVDADGRLETNCLKAVAPYFESPEVGGAQLPVRIWNNTDSWLARMQDIEFVGFSYFMQSARDFLGSVGLGGNGQFVRLTALQQLGKDPWTDCLTEDLDIGIRIIANGWKIRFCPNTFVAQHGLNSWKALMRQRTRWVQGHYSCTGHIWTLWTSRNIRLSARFDSTIYLAFVLFILMVGFNFLLSILGWLGLIIIENKVLMVMYSLPYSTLWTIMFALGPTAMFMTTYYRHTQEDSKMPILLFPLAIILFSFYAYVFIPANMKALWNLAVSNETWVKTPRSC
jgi:cellulose synthase/poly-beta-1,6-N-acetylglucosamine synthase-like glycosyltransferase